MYGARVCLCLLSGWLFLAATGCGSGTGHGNDWKDGEVTGDASGLDSAIACESNCEPEGEIICSLMGTRVKRCSAVAGGCLRWEVAQDCASQGMLCDETASPPACYSPPTCADGIQNQDETDVDCGGECGPCIAGSGCTVPEDCESGLCENGICLLCAAGTFRCRGNWLDICAPDGASWVPNTHCDMTAGVGCDADAGSCGLLQPIGNGPSSPTGWYYQFAYFTTSNSPLMSGGAYDVDAFGDYVFVNRDGANVDVYQVTLYDTDGDGEMEPNQHPDNPDHTGPIEERTIAYVQTYAVPTGGVHQNELYVTSNTIYFLGSDAIYSFDRLTSAVTTVVSMPSSGYSGAYETLGYNEVTGNFFFGTRDREVYSWDPIASEWVWETVYPNLAGSHMDGLEVVVDPNTGIPYVYVTDMTSDFIGQYKEDATGRWTQHNLFQYNNSTGDYIEGMGFGTLHHFWCGSGSVLYEIGGGDLAQYTESFSPTNQ